MQVSVQFFARARDLAGGPLLELSLPAGTSVRELREAIGAKIPALQPVLTQLFIAVNQNYVQDEDTVPDQAEVACFPPVSGG